MTAPNHAASSAPSPEVRRSFMARVRNSVVFRLRRARKAAVAVAKSPVTGWVGARHYAYEWLYRLPDRTVKRQWDATTSAEMRPYVNEIRKDGLVTLPAYVQGARLEQMKTAFDRLMTEIESAPAPPEQLSPPGGRMGGNHLHPRTPYREHQHSPEAGITNSHDPFKHDASFLKIALDEFIIGIAARYLNKPFALQQAIASRYYPFETKDFGSWQWHHDSWGTKINVMLLLTDVGENDQYMTFLKGSHRMYHSHKRTYDNDRFTEAEIQRLPGLERVKCLGPAGTVFIFDANGFHRGNRSLGATRDSIIWQFTAGRYLWPLTVPRSFSQGLSPLAQAALNNNPNIRVV